MTLVLDDPLLADLEEHEEDIPWVCEMKVQPSKTACPNEPVWVGHFACGCLAAVCEPHRIQYDEMRTRNSFFGQVTVHCGRHGAITCTQENAVRWSPL